MAKDMLLVMQEDLRKALLAPPGKRRWVMALDLRKCVGCHACTVACVSENRLPPGMFYRPVFEYERGSYPEVSRHFLPRPCMQCDKPPCVDVCPVKGKEGATWKETSGIGAGIVPINYDKCTGCGKCEPACPYQARAMDRGGFHTSGTPAIQRYETTPSFEYSIPRMRGDRTPPVGKARKCHFCMHRLEKGMLPQCITTCIGRAGYFGDAADPESLVASVIRDKKIQVLKGNLGTEPRVFYLDRVPLDSLYK